MAGRVARGVFAVSKVDVLYFVKCYTISFWQFGLC